MESWKGVWHDRNGGSRNDKDRETEREELPVMEVQHKGRANGAWIVGIYPRRQRNTARRKYICYCENAFRLRSDKAYSLIALNVEKDLQVHISSVTDPLAAWRTLQKQFEFVSVTQIVRFKS